MAFTFTTLKTAIQDYTQNTESTFVSQLPRFILNAEERLLKEVQLEVFRKNSQGTAASGNKFLSKPSDYLSTFSLSVIDSNVQTFLLLKHPTFLQDFTPNAVSTTGAPQYYANWDEDTFLLAPTPDSSYTMELHYFFRPISITTSGDGTSWLGTNAESTLLYGSLVEAYTFLKGDADMLNLYISRYEDALGKLKVLGEGYDTTDSYRSGTVRQARR